MVSIFPLNANLSRFGVSVVGCPVNPKSLFFIKICYSTIQANKIYYVSNDQMNISRRRRRKIRSVFIVGVVHRNQQSDVL